jgi:hypothetical protein
VDKKMKKTNKDSLDLEMLTLNELVVEKEKVEKIINQKVEKIKEQEEDLVIYKKKQIDILESMKKILAKDIKNLK